MCIALVIKVHVLRNFPMRLRIFQPIISNKDRELVNLS